jgi:hypothetical protein
VLQIALHREGYVIPNLLKSHSYFCFGNSPTLSAILLRPGLINRPGRRRGGFPSARPLWTPRMMTGRLTLFERGAS